MNSSPTLFGWLIVLMIIIAIALLIVLIWWSTAGSNSLTVDVGKPPDSGSVINTRVSVGYGDVEADVTNNTENIIINVPGVYIYIDATNPDFSSRALFETTTRTYWADSYWTLGNEIQTVVYHSLPGLGKTQITLTYPEATPHSSPPDFTDLYFTFNVPYIRSVFNGYYVDTTTVYNHPVDTTLTTSGVPIDIWGPSSGSYINGGVDIVDVNRPIIYWTGNIYDESFNVIGVITNSTETHVSASEHGILTLSASGDIVKFDNSIRVNGYGSPVPQIPDNVRSVEPTVGLNWPNIIFTNLWNIMYTYGAYYTSVNLSADNGNAFASNNLYVNGISFPALVSASTVQTSGDASLTSDYVIPFESSGLTVNDVSVNTGSNTISATITLTPGGIQTINSLIPIPINLTDPSTGHSSDFYIVFQVNTDTFETGTYQLNFSLTSYVDNANPSGSPPPQDLVVVTNVNSIIVPVIGTGGNIFPVYAQTSSGTPVGDGYYFASINVTLDPIITMSRDASRLRALYSSYSRDIPVEDSSSPSYVDWYGPTQPTQAAATASFTVESSFLDDVSGLPTGTDFSLSLGVYNNGTISAPVSAVTTLSFNQSTTVSSGGICGSSSQVSF